MGCNKNDVISEPKLTMGQTIQQYYPDIRIEQRQGSEGIRHKIFHGISYLNKEANSTKSPVQEQPKQLRPTSLTDLLKQEDDKNNDQQNH